AGGRANAFEVAPHIAAFDRVDVERRVVPALRFKYRAEQERSPAHDNAAGARERADTHGGGIGIGRSEFEPEIERGRIGHGPTIALSRWRELPICARLG